MLLRSGGGGGGRDVGRGGAAEGISDAVDGEALGRLVREGGELGVAVHEVVNTVHLKNADKRWGDSRKKGKRRQHLVNKGKEKKIWFKIRA